MFIQRVEVRLPHKGFTKDMSRAPAPNQKRIQVTKSSDDSENDRKEKVEIEAIP